MFAKMRSPVTLTASELDNYLARGWFRMRQNIFTTSFLQFDNQFYSVFWLRVALENFKPGKKQQQLYKLNSSFNFDISPSVITEQHELLYQAYRSSISFEVSGSLQELLLGNEIYNRYNTFSINIYDKARLVASGFFDIGKKSAAGISSFYDPAYKKHSLGKYLIFLKMDFCRQHQLQYFYPGYLVPGYKAFDYKAEIGRDQLEYFHLGSKQWLAYPKKEKPVDPLSEMVAELQKLKSHFEAGGISMALLYYKFFDANLDPGFYGSELFDFPVFLFCFPMTGSFDYHLIVYDVRDKAFHLLQCSSVIQLDQFIATDNIFSSGLLKIDKEFIATSNINELKSSLLSYL